MIVIERGLIKAAGDVREMARNVSLKRKLVRARALDGSEALQRALLEERFVVDVLVEGDACRFQFEGGDAELALLVQALMRRGLRLVSFAPAEANLEDVFLSVTEGRVQ